MAIGYKRNAEVVAASALLSQLWIVIFFRALCPIAVPAAALAAICAASSAGFLLTCRAAPITDGAYDPNGVGLGPFFSSIIAQLDVNESSRFATLVGLLGALPPLTTLSVHLLRSPFPFSLLPRSPTQASTSGSCTSHCRPSAPGPSLLF